MNVSFHVVPTWVVPVPSTRTRVVRHSTGGRNLSGPVKASKDSRGLLTCLKRKRFDSAVSRQRVVKRRQRSYRRSSVKRNRAFRVISRLSSNLLSVRRVTHSSRRNERRGK